MEPLAYKLRPKTFDDVIGQDHLVGKDGIIRKMLDNNHLSSFILYGDPGIGKTTIANIIAQYFPLNHYFFNASTDSKSLLKEMIDSNYGYDEILLIIDEIHRMKKDTQDYLLPFLENGKVIVIGITTENPYHALNPAIRSRVRIFRMNSLTNENIKKLIDNIINKYKLDIDDESIEYIIHLSNKEARSAINMLEVLISINQKIDVNTCKKYLGAATLKLDASSNNFYDCLSALQKSIRGSDVNASIHYLARLLTSNDLVAITRRLLAIAYEDIGLANPLIGVKVNQACEAAIKLGMPEAILPLSVIVCDMALSPKSNSAYLAINEAMADIESGNIDDIPSNIKNRDIKDGIAKYLYPHDYEGAWVNQEYMPKNLIGKEYYKPKDTGSYERALKENYLRIKKMKENK